MKIFEESTSNLKRHSFMSAVTIVSISLILVIFNVLITINFITKNKIEQFSNKINLKIFLEESANEEDISNIITYLNGFKSVTKITHISKEDSLQLIEEKYPESITFLDEFNIQNPLPESLEVKTKTLEDQTQINETLKKSKYKDLILNSDIKKIHNQTINVVVENLVKVKQFSFQILLWMIITFSIAGILIILNSIRTTLYNRRQEIQIMQFVGATFKRITLPFILEGMLIGAIAYFLNLAIIAIAGQFLPLSVGEGLSLLTSSDYLLILGLELVLVIAIGVITSLSVINGYLNSNEIFHE